MAKVVLEFPSQTNLQQFLRDVDDRGNRPAVNADVGDIPDGADAVVDSNEDDVLRLARLYGAVETDAEEFMEEL